MSNTTQQVGEPRTGGQALTTAGGGKRKEQGWSSVSEHARSFFIGSDQLQEGAPMLALSAAFRSS
jgi:hypothetical protein